MPQSSKRATRKLWKAKASYLALNELVEHHHPSSCQEAMGDFGHANRLVGITAYRPRKHKASGASLFANKFKRTGAWQIVTKRGDSMAKSARGWLLHTPARYPGILAPFMIKGAQAFAFSFSCMLREMLSCVAKSGQLRNKRLVLPDYLLKEASRSRMWECFILAI